MNRYIYIILTIICITACNKNVQQATSPTEGAVNKTSMTIAFGSCNHQEKSSPLWTDILTEKPTAFIWVGDIVYADTPDMSKMTADYQKVKTDANYQKLKTITEVFGVYDDHDYGINDGGKHWAHKKEAQQIAMDFLDIPKNAEVRAREGLYYTKRFKHPKGSIRVIVLDTRYHRDTLQPSTVKGIRYQAWGDNHQGSMLGQEQWAWLENELQDNSDNFTIIVSSIQVLSNQHGWEKWGNFPKERQRLIQLINQAKSPNISIISGDRHMAEISQINLKNKHDKLVDFTSSGLTHTTHVSSATEANTYRISNVVKTLNYGILQFDFNKNSINYQIKGVNGHLYDQYLYQFEK